MKYLFGLATVVAAAVLGGVAACGGEERMSREELSDRLQSIDQRGGELWGSLAQRAQALEPGQALPAGVNDALREIVDFQEQAVAELENGMPPDEADEPVEALIEALRDRTETFESAMEAGRFTRQQFDELTQAGEKIDRALRQLRDSGLLPASDAHDEG